ncbi:MAG: hypothetical protein UT24_C0029G0013 [Candidatus Woesebacteria bacterium GW2011_GWB1_39_12]|uniref:Uncharacterized protein n=1 Tax=Candidatus Woesebacteria bacterium GW2011_GWB1_39_12 TaxID=1618574 RepID=A0A0G0QBB2_9BACT|nr:MAG: hypothetical protein UT24_C0029G0013 [Candidatus Woesebacteria bacterium GW2011_GWB1_39_12]
MKEYLQELEKQAKQSQMSRREFLQTAGVIGGGLTLIGLGVRADQENKKDKVFHTEMDKDKILSFEETRDMVLYFDQISDLLPPAPIIPMNQKNMALLAIEVLPLMKSEGAVGMVRYPQVLEPVAYPDERHVQVLGQSNCNNAALATFRYANPFSGSYGDTEWMGVEIHELVHVQQYQASLKGKACTYPTTENTENTAQIVSWEIMAAMLNYGDRKMIYPLMDELKYRTLGANLALAMEDKRLNEYKKLAQKVNPSSMDAARRNKMDRYWKGRESERREILTNYGLQPMERLVYAIRENDSKVEGLALPDEYNTKGQLYTKPFLVDDLVYVIKNGTSIAQQIAHER